MSSIGVSLEIAHTSKNKKGDADGLFYAVKELVNEYVWNVTSTLTGFRAYLSTEEFAIHMSDRWDRSDTSLYYAYWEEEDPVLALYAIHIAEACLASSGEELEALGNEHGFAITVPTFERRGYFVMHTAQRVCRVEPWKRGLAIDAPPTYRCAHTVKPLSAKKLLRIRACAMTGLCACKYCFYQYKPDPLTAAIPKAWAALDGDKRGKKLTDPLVMGDWLKERGIELTQQQLVALVETYTQ